MDLHDAKANKVLVGACLRVHAHAQRLARRRCGVAKFSLARSPPHSV